MPSVISNLKAKINDLKTRVDHNSISPVFVGGILDEIVDASTAAAEAAAAQSTADSALALATANSDRLDLHADGINNLENDVANNAADIHVNTDALTILNRRGQVESFAAVLTTDPDDDPIPEELAGKRVWSTQFNKFLEINIGGDPPYREPEDSAAVVDKFYVCDGRLYLGVKVSQTATTLKPLFDSEIEQLCRTHSITLTRVADLRYSWSGAALGDIRQGDILTWTDTDEMFRAVVFGERTSGTRREVCAMFTRDGDEAIEFSLLWFHENGVAYETVFDSSQTLAWQFAARQNKLTDTADIQVRAEARPSGQHYTPYGLYLTDRAKRAVFIDRWNARCVDMYGNKCGGYNEATGYFELNGLTDITYAQAMEIMSSASYWCRTPIGSMPSMSLLNIRTAFPFGGYGNSLGAVALNSTFKNCEKLEAVVVQNGNFTPLNGTFLGCKKLRKVVLNTEYSTSFDNAAFYQCYALEELSVQAQILSNINLSPCSRLSVASASNITAKGKSGISVTVHADVFAKLTGDTTNPAVAALTPAELAEWQQILTAATEKNISFTTP